MLPVIERFVATQTWLDSLGDPLQNALNSLFKNNGPAAQQAKNMLNGTWLGHPLHPVLTDVPVGAFTCTMVLDAASALSDSEGLNAAADITMATGLLGATGSALSGWADWSDTYGKDRKVGLLHGLSMVTMYVLYAGSFVARRRGARTTGTVLSTVGYGVLSAAAYLGGDEVFDLGYGVNHTAFEQAPSKYVPAMAEAELEANKPTQAEAGGIKVLLVKQQGHIYALNDTCTHAGCSLAGGQLDGGTIVCPCHGSQFDLADGSIVRGPATYPEQALAVRVHEGMIEVKQA